MPDENELEELTNGFLDDTMKAKGVIYNGRKAEQTEVMGALAEHSGADRVSGKDIRTH